RSIIEEYDRAIGRGRAVGSVSDSRIGIIRRNCDLVNPATCSSAPCKPTLTVKDPDCFLSCIVHAGHGIRSVRCDGQADCPATPVVPQHAILEVKKSRSFALVDDRAIIGRKRDCSSGALERSGAYESSCFVEEKESSIVRGTLVLVCHRKVSTVRGDGCPGDPSLRSSRIPGGDSLLVERVDAVV